MKLETFRTGMASFDADCGVILGFGDASGVARWFGHGPGIVAAGWMEGNARISFM